MKSLCHPGEAFIESDTREFTATPGAKLLYNSDGEVLFAFSPEWTDSQIRKALEFANKAFDRGVTYGESIKTAEIRKALGIEGANA